MVEGFRNPVEWFQMSLNIKSESAHALARQLAALTGESMTVAVEVALRERLQRTKKSAGKGLAERLMQIGKDCAPRLRNVQTDHGELLYGEDGLPR